MTSPPMDKLMVLLLNTINEQTPVTYASILEQYSDRRTCKVSSCLRRLAMRDLVEYDSGKYYITTQGREEAAQNNGT
jgi:Mn-dependent DtxR family transcriptional regulator